jgi:conjugative transfer pilus assembly protein TraH
MFQSWGTFTTNRPGAFNAQQRGFLSGGSLSVRVYRRPLPPLVTFSSPRFNVGCNGIDVYLGAFSYAGAQRYIQLLQQLGMSVVSGFAFQIAMKVLCESCADVLNKLENAIRQLNALANIQPCQTSISQLKNQGKQFLDAVNSTVESVGVATGVIKDPLDRRDERGNKTVAEGIAELASRDDTRMTANLVWDTLRRAGVDRDTAHLIMSTTGTAVVDQNGYMLYPPSLDLDTLVDTHPGQPVTLITCPDDQCLEPNSSTRQWLVTGFKERVNLGMSGLADAIYNHGPLTNEQEELIRLAPTPILQKLEERSVAPQKMEWYTQQNTEIIAIRMALAWVRYAVDEAIRKSLDISRVYPNIYLPAENLSTFRKSTREYLRDAENRAAIRLEVLNVISEETEHGPQTSQGASIHQLKQLNRPANLNPTIQAGR